MCKNKKELDLFVAKYRELAAAQKLIEEQMKGVKKEIKEYTIKKGKPVDGSSSVAVFGDDYKITYSEVTSTSLDTDKVKTYLGDTLPEFQKESTSYRLTVS